MKKEDKIPEYIICPRCELNYITKKEKLCPVCKAERGLYDKSILLPDEEETERLCPICKVNYLAEDEEICFICQKEKNATARDEVFLGDIEDDDKIEVDELEISLEHVAEEESEEEEDLFVNPDDIEYEDELEDDFDNFEDDFDLDEDLEEDEEELDDDEDI